MNAADRRAANRRRVQGDLGNPEHPPPGFTGAEVMALSKLHSQRGEASSDTHHDVPEKGWTDE
jgi:hypothetical protein